MPFKYAETPPGAQTPQSHRVVARAVDVRSLADKTRLGTLNYHVATFVPSGLNLTPQTHERCADILAILSMLDLLMLRTLVTSGAALTFQSGKPACRHLMRPGVWSRWRRLLLSLRHCDLVTLEIYSYTSQELTVEFSNSLQGRAVQDIDRVLPGPHGEKPSVRALRPKERSHGVSKCSRMSCPLTAATLIIGVSVFVASWIFDPVSILQTPTTPSVDPVNIRLSPGIKHEVHTSTSRT